MEPKTLTTLKPADFPPQIRSLKSFRLTGTRVLVRMTKPQSKSTIILLPPGGADQSAASPLGRVIACGPDVCPDIEPGQYVLATSQQGPELFRDIVTDNSWRLFDHTDIRALIYLEDN